MKSTTVIYIHIIIYLVLGSVMFFATLIHVVFLFLSAFCFYICSQYADMYKEQQLIDQMIENDEERLSNPLIANDLYEHSNY